MDNKEIWNECFDKVFEELKGKVTFEELENVIDLIAYIIKENGYSIIKNRHDG